MRLRSLATAVAAPVLLAACASAPDTRWCDRLPRPAYAALERVRVAQPWFEVYRVGDGVFAIYEPFQFQEVISYLIVGSARALLFDSGMGIGRIGDIVGELTALPVRVANSHSHLDHVGGNAEFGFVYGVDTDFTRARATGMAGPAVLAEVAPEALCRPLPGGQRAADYRIRPWTIAAHIGDRSIIDLGDRRLEVLAVPGHTPDSIALLERDTGYLWTGDTFYEGPVWLFAPETDLARYQASVDRLAALAPSLTRVFAAHNTPVAPPRRLPELAAAVRAVRSGTKAPDRQRDGANEYDFGAFSLLIGRGITGR